MESSPVRKSLDRGGTAVVQEFRRTAPVLTGRFRQNVRKVWAHGADGRPAMRVEVYDSPDEMQWRGSAARSIERGTNDTPAHRTLARAISAVGGRRSRAGIGAGISRTVGPRGGAV
jgi:hypothetical protein